MIIHVFFNHGKCLNLFWLPCQPTNGRGCGGELKKGKKEVGTSARYVNRSFYWSTSAPWRQDWLAFRRVSTFSARCLAHDLIQKNAAVHVKLRTLAIRMVPLIEGWNEYSKHLQWFIFYQSGFEQENTAFLAYFISEIIFWTHLPQCCAPAWCGVFK
jgi:hypothetical protein